MPMHFSSVDAQNLRLMAFDVDGVMTDGRLLFGPQGEELKVFNTLDGHGLKKLAASGVTLAIITGRNSPMVAKRAADLGIEHVIQGREDKGVALEALADSLNIAAHETGYAGDDEPDVSALLWAQLSFAPANAHDCAKTASDYITERRGGEGAVREICDAILALRSQA
ncbi:KdsC family phosphatase [Alcanivorax sp.]|uniref:KdsC family phosphatase n=1 Tax=Alcanivorax sp. TaxID=1872427 RepID=UPI002B27AF44|nr:HAD hydrolase family protein [Alcanivorax sp.]